MLTELILIIVYCDSQINDRVRSGFDEASAVIWFPKFRILACILILSLINIMAWRVDSENYLNRFLY